MSDKIYNNKVIAKLRTLADSVYFPLALGGAVVVLYVLKLYVTALCLLALLATLIFLFSRDLRAVLPLVAYAPMTLSFENPALGKVDYLALRNLIPLIIFGVAVVASLAFNLIAYRKGRNYKSLGKARLLIGLCGISLAMIVGGAFGGYYDAMSLVLGLSYTAALLPAYVVFFTCMENRADNLRYLAILCCCVAGVILCQLAHVYIATYEWGAPLDSGWKSQLKTSWAISNGIGLMLTMMIPACFYMIYKEKRGYLYYILLALVIVGIYFTLCRNALLWGGLAVLIGGVFNCIKGENVKINRIITAVIAVGVIAFAVVALCSGKLDGVLAFFSNAGLSDSGRFTIWSRWLKLFTKEPILGMGFRAYRKVYNVTFAVNAHNTLVQMLTGTGILGFTMYLYHRYETVKMIVKNPSTERIMLISVAVIGVLASLLSTLFFTIYFQLFYAMVLVVVEKTIPPVTDEKSEEQPSQIPDLMN